MTHKPLRLFSLAMINLAAIGAVKNWPVSAVFGLSSVFYLLLAAIIFLIPVGLVAAELATGWPKAGGVFAWVKEAFGHRTGFLAIWLLWIQNVLWYPTVLSFISATVAYFFDPALAENNVFLFSCMVSLFWLMTFANCFGIKISSRISTIGVIFGTFIAGLIIIFLGISWFLNDKPLQITFDWSSAIPSFSSPDQIVFFTGVILTLCGLEMSAIYAKDVENPQKNYPKAILLSVSLILGMSLLGVLAIAGIVPKDKISLTAGSLQAFSYFIEPYHQKWMLPSMAALVALGAIGSLSTWILGPSRGLLEAARNGDLPPICRKHNRHGVPTFMLFLQAVIVTVLSMLFLFTPSINNAYFLILIITAQLYLITYTLMFSAAIKLRYTQPETPRTYKIPGGKAGMWFWAGLGIFACLLSFFVGFFPPEQLPMSNPLFYILFLVIGIILACITPWVILLFQKEHWKHPLSHEKHKDL